MNVLLAAATSVAERIRINALTREWRGERLIWIKRRRPTAPPVLATANLFFRCVGARIQAIDHAPRWQQWEVACFRELHGDRYTAWAEGRSGVAAEALPGISLAQALDSGDLTLEQAAAAGRELRRAHEWHCPEFAGAWSHGDPHSGNFLYEAAEDRARLIDFEVLHDRRLSAAERHADDLLIFLQDVLGRIAAARWLPIASAFLDGYAREEIIALLAPQLILPRGLPRLWWAIRTGSLPSSEVIHRLSALRGALAKRATLAAA